MSAVPIAWLASGTRAAAASSGALGRESLTPADRIDAVRRLELAGVDLVVLTDAGVTPGDPGEHDATFETFPLAAMLASTTANIGIAATYDMSTWPPFLLARSLTTLDHHSSGRAAWNVTASGVTTTRPGSMEVDGGDVDIDDYLVACAALWTSWEPDAVVGDWRTGTLADPAKVHAPHHVGPKYRTRGPLNALPSPQRAPVTVCLVSSADGIARAASVGEVVVVQAGDQQQLGELLDRLHDALVSVGRDPKDTATMAAVRPFVAATGAGGRLLEERCPSSSSASVPLHGPADHIADELEHMLDGCPATGIAIDGCWQPYYVGTVALELMPVLRRRGLTGPAGVAGTSLRDVLGTRSCLVP